MKVSIWRTAAVAVVLLTGCSGAHSVTQSMGNSNSGGVSQSPQVVQTGKLPINWTQFTDPGTGFGNSFAIAVGSDKNIWVGNNQNGLMRVSMTGSMKLFHMTFVCSGTSSCGFTSGYGIAVGSDGKFYMTGTNYDYNKSKYVVGVATTAGALTVHDIPSGTDYGGSGGLALGPDGNVWFTEQKSIAKITTGGTVTEKAYPSGATSNSYGDVAAGPDGNVWFTEYNNGIVGKINPSSMAITEYTLSTQSISCNPEAIIAGADGFMYFTCNGYNTLGQITTGGVAKTFYDPYGMTYLAQGLAKGPDGHPWFADGNGAYIGEFNSSNNSFTNYIPPYTGGTVYNLVLGPDGNFWSPESDNKINVYIIKTLVVSPATLTFTAVAQTANLTVTEPSTSSWTATSVSPGVCGVALGGSANIFKVTANGVGNTKITIKDAIGNSFVVPCKVS